MYHKQPYVTEQAHGRHPAGSKVLASKDDFRTLILEYENGDVIEIPNGWCRGLEKDPNHYTLVNLLSDIAANELYAQEDAQFLAHINLTVESKK